MCDMNLEVRAGIFERYLSVWVGLCILLGVVLGNAVPDVFARLLHLSLRGSIWVALIWIDLPMMVQVDFGSIRDIRNKPKGLITWVVNWLIKPFTMAALGWLFSGCSCRFVDPETVTNIWQDDPAGGLAAMVFGGSLTRDANYARSGLCE